MGIDSVVVAAQIMNSLQTIVSRNLAITNHPAIVTVGSIHGGLRSNIIPEKVELVGTIRALDSAIPTASLALFWPSECIGSFPCWYIADHLRTWM